MQHLETTTMFINQLNTASTVMQLLAAKYKHFKLHHQKHSKSRLQCTPTHTRRQIKIVGSRQDPDHGMQPKNAGYKTDFQVDHKSHELRVLPSDSGPHVTPETCHETS